MMNLNQVLTMINWQMAAVRWISFDTIFDREFFAKVKMKTNQYARQQLNESTFAKWNIHVQYCCKHTDGKDYLPSVKYIFLS